METFLSTDDRDKNKQEATDGKSIDARSNGLTCISDFSSHMDQRQKKDTSNKHMDQKHRPETQTRNMDQRHGPNKWTRDIDQRHGPNKWTRDMDQTHGHNFRVMILNNFIAIFFLYYKKYLNVFACVCNKHT